MERLRFDSKLYNAVIQQGTRITHAVVGRFLTGNINTQTRHTGQKSSSNTSSMSKLQLLVVYASNVMALYQLNAETAQLELVSRQQQHCFGTVKCIYVLKFPTSSTNDNSSGMDAEKIGDGSLSGDQDYVVLLSEAGNLVILQYNEQVGEFLVVRNESFGKVGINRGIPSEYLAVDPHGRCCLISALEYQKFAFILSLQQQTHTNDGDQEQQLDSIRSEVYVSSPLSCHRRGVVVFDLCALHVGYENPVFASIEYNQPESGRDVGLHLVFYQVDLGLNQLTVLKGVRLHADCNRLIPLHGGGLLCCESDGSRLLHFDHRFQFREVIDMPVCATDSTQDVQGGRGMIMGHCLIQQNVYMLINECGDTFILALKGDSVLNIQYYDTVGLSSSVVVLYGGLIFCVGDSGDNLLIQLQGVKKFISTSVQVNYRQQSMDSDNHRQKERLKYERTLMKNAAFITKLDSIAPVIAAKVISLDYSGIQNGIAVLSGSDSRSSLKLLRNGCKMEINVTFPLQGTPTNVWSLKKAVDDEYDQYMVISFQNATLVLEVVGDSVEQVAEGDVGILSSLPSLNVVQLGRDGILQVLPFGMRHIKRKADGQLKIVTWNCPGGTSIVLSACNNRQIDLVLNDGRMIYFELDESDSIAEYEDHLRLDQNICSLGISKLSPDIQKVDYLVVGCADCSIRVLSLKEDDCLQTVGMQLLNAVPVSILINESVSEMANYETITTYLSIGLDNGVMFRSVMDPVNGTISDTRSRYLGPSPVKLSTVYVEGQSAIIASSTQTWISYQYLSQNYTLPVILPQQSIGPLTVASALHTEQNPEEILAISGNDLVILSIDSQSLGKQYQSDTVSLTYTPRLLEYEQASQLFIIAESQHAVKPVPIDTQLQRIKEHNQSKEEEEDDSEEYHLQPLNIVSQPSQWSAQLRLINVNTLSTLQLIPLAANESITCMKICSLFSATAQSSHQYLAVGVVSNLSLGNKVNSGCYIDTYFINGQQLQFVHRTEVECPVYALCPFQGRLLAGVGRTLRLYELGMKKLLRKLENCQFPVVITDIQVMDGGNSNANNQLIYVQDIQESVQYVSYEHTDNKFIIVVDDVKPRWMTRFCIVDADTVAGADKFGNFFVLQLPKSVSDGLNDDVLRGKYLYQKNFLNGAAHKLEQVCQYHLGDIITSMQFIPLLAGGRQVVVYVTIQGEIGMFIPFAQGEDVELFQELELILRNEFIPLSGYDHLRYRSTYLPVKRVIDGRLIEQFNALPYDRRAEIGQDFDRQLSDISRQIELLKTRVS
ncbi:hypothetical protein MP228_000609 [Amoeboaphelidium protococcarum]|nr:hypothetical protein MP228_000609 [Amoeboaphelidium protococcarum]